jgi:hypothetical protein
VQIILKDWSGLPSLDSIGDKLGRRTLFATHKFKMEKVARARCFHKPTNTLRVIVNTNNF